MSSQAAKSRKGRSSVMQPGARDCKSACQQIPTPKLSIPVTNIGQPKKTPGLLPFHPSRIWSPERYVLQLNRKGNFVCKVSWFFFSCKPIQTFLGPITFKQAVPWFQALYPYYSCCYIRQSPRALPPSASEWTHSLGEGITIWSFARTSSWSGTVLVPGQCLTLGVTQFPRWICLLIGFHGEVY